LPYAQNWQVGAAWYCVSTSTVALAVNGGCCIHWRRLWRSALTPRYLAANADEGSQCKALGMTSVRGLGVAVPEKLAKDQRVEDYCILSALCGETTMAINVFGVLIWCGLGHCSPIRRACAKLPILLLSCCVVYPAHARLRDGRTGSTDAGTGAVRLVTWVVYDERRLLFVLQACTGYHRTWRPHKPVMAPSELVERH
jgi:hypothetical protein